MYHKSLYIDPDILACSGRFGVQKNNSTIKYLVGICPNGSIRTDMDVLLWQRYNFGLWLCRLWMLVILLLLVNGIQLPDTSCSATLEFPPSSSGVDQQVKAEVTITKKVTNARIHVERDIGRWIVYNCCLCV